MKLDVLVPERRSGVHLCGRLFWVSDFFALGLWAGLLARLRAPTTQQQSAMVVAMEASVAPKKVIIDTDPGIGRPKSQTHSPSSTIGFESSVWDGAHHLHVLVVVEDGRSCDPNWV